MKATEIVEKFKNVLLGAEVEGETKEEIVEAKADDVSENKEKTLLSEETKENNKKEETVELEEAPTEEETKEELDEDVYATKQELAELRGVVDQLRGMIKPVDQSLEVPKEELSSVESEVEPLIHNPEGEENKPLNVNLKRQKGASTLDRVMQKISNI
tara:strand:+ start:12836 stop:13309 length:474 start_codon:yes stop_codon:yes gene_type:complete